MRDSVKSYKQLPLNLYQIRQNTAMKNAHGTVFFGPVSSSWKMVIASMLTTIAWMCTYDEYKAAYERIFTRSGIDFKAIIGDGGAMGGKKIAKSLWLLHLLVQTWTVGLF